MHTYSESSWKSKPFWNPVKVRISRNVLHQIFGSKLAASSALLFPHRPSNFLPVLPPCIFLLAFFLPHRIWFLLKPVWLRFADVRLYLPHSRSLSKGFPMPARFFFLRFITQSTKFSRQFQKRNCNESGWVVPTFDMDSNTKSKMRSSCCCSCYRLGHISAGSLFQPEIWKVHPLLKRYKRESSQCVPKTRPQQYQ